MTIQTINIGNIANDGTGDDLREAFAKVNNNFTEIDTRVIAAEGSDAVNIGGGTGIFSEKLSNELQFKSLVGSGINITSSNTEVTLTSNAVDQVIMVSDSGSIVLTRGSSSVNLYGGTNIDTRVTGTQIFFDVDPVNLVQLDLNPTLGGNLDANQNTITNASTIISDNFLGNVTGLVHNIDIREISTFITGFDFNGIVKVANNFVDWLTLNTSVDYGSFTAPIDISSDFGTLA